MLMLIDKAYAADQLYLCTQTVLTAAVAVTIDLLHRSG